MEKRVLSSCVSCVLFFGKEHSCSSIWWSNNFSFHHLYNLLIHTFISCLDSIILSPSPFQMLRTRTARHKSLHKIPLILWSNKKHWIQVLDTCIIQMKSWIQLTALPLKVYQDNHPKLQLREQERERERRQTPLWFLRRGKWGIFVCISLSLSAQLPWFPWVSRCPSHFLSSLMWLSRLRKANSIEVGSKKTLRMRKGRKLEGDNCICGQYPVKRPLILH